MRGIDGGSGWVSGGCSTGADRMSALPVKTEAAIAFPQPPKPTINTVIAFSKLISGRSAWRRSAAVGGPTALPGYRIPASFFAKATKDKKAGTADRRWGGRCRLVLRERWAAAWGQAALPYRIPAKAGTAERRWIGRWRLVLRGAGRRLGDKPPYLLWPYRPRWDGGASRER